MTTHATTPRSSAALGLREARPARHDPGRHLRSGPTAALVELPDSTELDPTSSGQVGAYLSRLEVARQRQLDLLPGDAANPVAAAHRGTVVRLLDEVRSARPRPHIHYHFPHRFILADTEQLHEKIYEMSNRIRQLEDALAILQSTVTDQRHPLLSDELLKVKFGSEAINAKQSDGEEERATNKSIDSLGTLSLGSSGKMQYFGGSAGSEVRFLLFAAVVLSWTC